VSAPLGIRLKTPVPLGREQTSTGTSPVRWSSLRTHRPPGASNRVAGGRTSVSAPLGIRPKTLAQMGREPTIDRPKGPAVPPARPIGPGTTPNDMYRPNGPTVPLMDRAVRRTVGPLGRTMWWWGAPPGPTTLAGGMAGPLGRRHARPKSTPTSPTRSRPEFIHRHRPTRTPSDSSTTALKGHKRVAGGWSEALPPDSRPPTHAEPRSGFQRIGKRRSSGTIAWHFRPTRPTDHVRRLDSYSTATSDHRRLEPLSGFWPDVGIAFRGYRVAEPPATLWNPFGDDVPGPDGLGARRR